MTNFLIVYEQIDNTVQVNLSAIKSIFSVDNVALRYRLSSDVSKLDLNWCDCCYAIRPSSVYTHNIAKALKSSSRFFVSQFDDDLLNICNSSSLYWRIKYMKSCLLLSDFVVACNPQIIETYKKEISPNPKYILSQAFVLESEIQPIKEAGEKIRIVYVAGRDHTILFETFISPIIDDIFAKHPNKIELHLMGVDPDLSKIVHRKQIISHSPRNYDDYKEFMRANKFDIGIAPLFDNSFSRKKYFRKYIDYAEFGILGLYSNCLPYTLVVKNGFNGILVNNEPNAWLEALIYAIDNVAELKSLVRNAQNNLKQDFSLESVKTHFWRELSPLLSDYRSKAVLTYHNNIIESTIYEIMVKYHRVRSHIKTDGVWETVRKVLSR